MWRNAGRWLVYGIAGAIVLAAAGDTGLGSLLFTTLTAWGIVGLLLVVGLRPTVGDDSTVGRLHLAIELPLLALLLVGGLSAFWWTVDQGGSHLGLIKLANFVLLALLLPRLLSRPESYRPLFLWIALLAGLLAAYGFLQWPLGSNRMGGRLHSFFLTPNSLAGFLVATLPVTVALFVTARRRAARWGCLALALLQAAALAATGSRGGWLAGGIGLALLIALLWRSPMRADWRWTLRPLAVGGMVLALAVIVMGWRDPALIWPRLASLSDPLSAEPHRYLYWQSTIGMITERPWTGWGIGTFGIVYHQFKSPLFEDVTQNYAHNDYLQVTAEMGLPGLAALLWLIGGAGWAVHRCRRQSHPPAAHGSAMLAGVAAGIAAVLLHSLVDFDLYVPAILSLVAIFLAYLTSCRLSQTGVSATAESPVLRPLTSRAALCALGGLLLALLVVRPYLAGREYEAGQALMARGDYQAAAERFLQAIDYHPQAAAYYGSLGFAYEHWANDTRRLDLLVKAEAAFQAATVVGPADYHHHWNLGKFYKNYSNFSASLRDYDPWHAYRRAIELYPTKAALRQELEALEAARPQGEQLFEKTTLFSLTEWSILLSLS
jgi:O-antigen ligase